MEGGLIRKTGVRRHLGEGVAAAQALPAVADAPVEQEGVGRETVTPLEGADQVGLRQPGATALTRMPSLATSLARPRVRVSMAAFEAA